LRGVVGTTCVAEVISVRAHGASASRVLPPLMLLLPITSASCSAALYRRLEQRRAA
jgi:hypothetical protein